MTNWVEREAKRTNRNLLIVNLVSLAVCLAMMFPLYEEEKKEANFTPMVALVALVLFTAWNCLKGMRRMSDIQSTPTWKEAAIYGNVEQIAAQVEQEEQMEVPINKFLTVTRSWILYRGPFKTSVWPLTALLWVYRQTTRVYTYAIIRIGKYESVIIVNRRGKKIEVRMPPRKLEALIAQLAERLPWVFFGYSDELAYALQKDLAGMVAAVD